MNTLRLGILGGTYHPVHWGHIKSAEAVCQALHLDKILMVPASLPPHKEVPDVNFDTRLHMIQIAIQDRPLLEVSDIEKHIQPSYTLKTLQALKAQTQATLYLLMGHDTFLGLPTWYEWQRLLSYCHIVVMSRPGNTQALSPLLTHFLKMHQADTLSRLDTAESGCIYFITLPPIAISSTEVRTKLRQGEAISGFCPEGVIDFIKANHLYGASETDHFKRGTYAY